MPTESGMRSLRPGERRRLNSEARRSGSFDLDRDVLLTHQLDAGSPVDPTTPVVPEEWCIPNG
ncbi:hypothetical protein [Ktedonobacter robiniae]|uniref:hypothetical protein n=1 Tax=Ktedonobacter robiniae TaxID=2778365 RepID=UPI00191542CF|nr:hypothetical protein [Ktedonobacter robiniae]